MIFFKTCSREWRYPDQAGEGEDAAEAGAEGPHRQGGAVCQAQGRLCSNLRLYINLMVMLWCYNYSMSMIFKQSQYYPNSIIIKQSIFIEISIFCLYLIFEINEFKEWRYLFTSH